MNILRAILIGLIRLYQVAVSPLIGRCCRFHPSCSEYAVEALRTHGCLRGIWLVGTRLMKCHPWHPGGEDPVPVAGLTIRKRA